MEVLEQKTKIKTKKKTLNFVIKWRSKERNPFKELEHHQRS